MKALGVRQWMVVGIGVFFASTLVFYHLADTVYGRVLQPRFQPPAQTNAALATTAREIAGASGQWRDRAWQAALQQRLDQVGLQVLIVDATGAPVMRSAHLKNVAQPRQQAVVIAGEQQLGTVELFVPDAWPGPGPLSALVAMVGALVLIQRQMGRTMVRPLEALSRAARRIADGDLHFDIPPSRVREVRDVCEAFAAMAAGLRDSIARQAALEEQRRFFVGAIAHDLRTPLFALRGYLEGLERGLATSPRKTAEYIAVCRQKADQLDRLVADLFTYTKADYGAQTLRAQPVAFAPLMHRIDESVRARAHAQSVRVVFDGTNEACVCHGDAHLLERMLDNLLDNALRYTSAGGTVEVRWWCEREQIKFTVADTGPGIAPADLPHLFEPLYRSDAARSQETGGAGLGLTIAQRIVQAHGGTLHAANRPGGGAIFTGCLPQAHALSGVTIIMA